MEEAYLNLFFQYFMAPVIVALIVIIFQLLFSHIVASRKLKVKEEWLEKKRVFSEALRVLDKSFSSGDIIEPSNEKRHIPLPNEKPSSQEMNEAYRGLLLVVKNPEILRFFIKLMGQGGNLVERARFINLLRKELFGSTFEINVGEVGFFLNTK